LASACGWRGRRRSPDSFDFNSAFDCPDTEWDVRERSSFDVVHDWNTFRSYDGNGRRWDRLISDSCVVAKPATTVEKLKTSKENSDGLKHSANAF